MDATLPPANEPTDVLMNLPTDIMDAPLIEPVSSPSESKPASEVVSEPSDDFVDLTNNITDSPDDSVAAEIAVADAAKDSTEISLDVPTEIPLDEPSDDFIDIIRSETRAPEEEVVFADVTVEAPTDKSEVTSGSTDPPAEGETGENAEQAAKETSTAPVDDLFADMPVSNTQKLPVIDKIVDPLVDLLSDAPPAADAKKPSQATVDLFEDEGSDLFTEPRQTKSAKQPQKSLFGEPDEDLFGEPLGATAKKTISKEQKEKSVMTKAAGVSSNIGGPLQDSNPAEPADIFTEEAITSVPSIKSTSTVNSKTNGVHSEEETDIFAGRYIVFYNFEDFRIWILKGITGVHLKAKCTSNTALWDSNVAFRVASIRHLLNVQILLEPTTIFKRPGGHIRAFPCALFPSVYFLKVCLQLLEVDIRLLPRNEWRQTEDDKG